MNTDRFQPPGPRDEEGYASRRENAELHAADRAHDMQRDDEIEDLETAKASPAVRAAVCAVCRAEWVDVMAGEDTCQICRNSTNPHHD